MMQLFFGFNEGGYVLAAFSIPCAMATVRHC